jgi:hypothetical protein
MQSEQFGVEVKTIRNDIKAETECYVQDNKEDTDSLILLNITSVL